MTELEHARFRVINAYGMLAVQACGIDITPDYNGFVRLLDQLIEEAAREKVQL